MGFSLKFFLLLNCKNTLHQKWLFLCLLKTTSRFTIIFLIFVIIESNVIAFYELGVFCGTLCCQYFCWFVVINIVHDFVFILWFCCASDLYTFCSTCMVKCVSLSYHPVGSNWDFLPVIILHSQMNRTKLF